MVEWLDANIAYWHWVVIGLVLSAAEILLPSFFMLWLGVSAILVGIISYFVDISFTVQLSLWIVFSIASLIGWFKYISPLMKTRSLSGMAKEAAIGQQGIITDFIEEKGRGHVRFTVPLLGNSDWQCISDESMKVGDRARVIEVTGNSLLVKKA